MIHLILIPIDINTNEISVLRKCIYRVRHQPLPTNPTRISSEVNGDGIIIF